MPDAQGEGRNGKRLHMVDFKHMHRSNRIEPASVRFRNGWNSRIGVEFAKIVSDAVVMALVILAAFYALSEAVIKGWIG